MSQDPKELIAVTGGSGYIGGYIVRDLLAKGYRVRAIVRDLNKPEKFDYLRKFPQAQEHLELAAADIQEGNYAEILKGCSILIHTASPYFYTANDPQKEIVQPAIDGTLNALKGALQAGLKRVVITSSGGAIFHFPVPPNYVFTDKDWNTWSTLENGAYFLSKKLAEEAAWKFYEEHKAQLEVVVVNPLFVAGPPLNNILNTSLETVKGYLTGEKKVQPGAVGVVDVRDVSTAHVIAATHKDAVGKRLIASGGVYGWKDLAAQLKRLFPKFPVAGIDGLTDPSPFSMDTSNLQNLGQPPFIPLERTLVDTVNALVEHKLVSDLR